MLHSSGHNACYNSQLLILAILCNAQVFRNKFYKLTVYITSCRNYIAVCPTCSVKAMFSEQSCFIKRNVPKIYPTCQNLCCAICSFQHCFVSVCFIYQEHCSHCKHNSYSIDLYGLTMRSIIQSTNVLHIVHIAVADKSSCLFSRAKIFFIHSVFIHFHHEFYWENGT